MSPPRMTTHHGSRCSRAGKRARVPEGPAVHRIADRQRELVGRRVAAGALRGESTTVANEIDGRVLDDIETVGKHLLYRFGDRVLHVQFGAHGDVERVPVDAPAPDDVQLRLGGDDFAWDLHDTRVCEVVDDRSAARLRRRLGPDPLRADANATQAWDRFHTFDGPVAAALVQQSVVAGIGNRLRCEVLHEIRLHPMTPASAITFERFTTIWDAVRRAMRAEMTGDENSAVYRRRRCAVCGTPIARAAIANRTVYFCPSCQRP